MKTPPLLLRSPESLAQMVESGDRIYIGSNCAEPQTLVQALFQNRDRLSGVDIIHLLTLGDAPYANPEYREHFRHQAFFVGKNVRQAVKTGDVDYIPVFLGEIPRLFENGQLPIDVAMITVSPPDEHGYCSLGISVDLGLAACRCAKLVLAEINPEMPRTHGDSFIHVSEIDGLCESTYPLIEHLGEPADDVSRRIAKYIAELIEDGSTLQGGIGAIPNAVLSLIGDKNDLGIHTELFSDGLIEPIQAGIVNCDRKTINRGKVVSSFCIGSKRLYEYIDDNPFFEFRQTGYVNDPFVISQHERMVAINSALQVDLTGQVVSDSIGHSIYSGFGGQVDFIRGAARSKRGKAIIALPSTAKSGAISRIVSELSPGAGVVTSRADVHYVVTEYGVAYLHGKPIRERALDLIRISHPDFQDQLLEEAKEFGLISRSQPSIHYRYPDERVKEVVLHDGTEVTVRPIKPSDDGLLKEHFYSLGEETVRRRFGGTVKRLSTATISELVNVDHDSHVAFVATIPRAEGEQILGTARYYVDRSTGIAEIAMAVLDKWQRRKVGALLFTALLDTAREAKLNGIEAWVQSDNSAMIKLLMNAGLDVQANNEGGMTHVVLTFPSRSQSLEELPPVSA